MGRQRGIFAPFQRIWIPIFIGMTNFGGAITLQSTANRSLSVHSSGFKTSPLHRPKLFVA
jgi:hypothetical protein